jgi:hypothetical protein
VVKKKEINWQKGSEEANFQATADHGLITGKFEELRLK